MSTIRFDGWPVAQLDLELPFASWGDKEHVLLYRTATAWTLLTVAVDERYDEHGTPVAGRGIVSAQTLSTESLAEAVRDRYGESGWRDLLDVAHDRDTELYRAWVPTRLERDFDAASLHCKDLALYTGLLGGGPVPAPGRELPGWDADALGRMAEHLDALGFDVVEQRLVDTTDETDPDNPTLGTLRVRRYGFEAIGVVRVDDVGEIYVRLPHVDDIDEPPVRELRGLDDADSTLEVGPPGLDW